MPGNAIENWLKTKQRKARNSASMYFSLTSTGGIMAMLPNLVILLLIFKLLVLLILPTAPHPGIWAAIITTPLLVLTFIDCVRAERDDMAIIPLWLFREYFHIGPRLILEGRQAMVHARAFARIDTAMCAEVLAVLASRNTPASRRELMQALPGLSWQDVTAQLRLIQGVIVFRNADSVSLIAPLRFELRRLLGHRVRVEFAKQEPEPTPVDEPQQLSASEILGVSATASLAEIKSAYRARVKECHPDRFANTDDRARQLAEEWTKALNAAYEELLGQRNRRRS